MVCRPSPPSNPQGAVDHAVAALRADPLAELIGRLASQRGIACHAVGGTVRDRFLGRPFPDLDLVVERDGAGIAGALADAIGGRLVQISSRGFPLWRVVPLAPSGPWSDIGPIDLWDREGAPLAQDLARRDFTVNAMAVVLGTAAADLIADPFGGLADLAARRLRAVAAENLRQDPLRVLRAARLVAVLAEPGRCFQIEPRTAEAARAAAPLVPGVAGERLRDELEKLFRASGGTDGGAVRGAEALETLDLHPGLWLRLSAPTTPARPPAIESGPAGPSGSSEPSELGTVTRSLSGLLRRLEEIAAPGSPLGRHLDARPDGAVHGSPAPAPLLIAPRTLARWAASFLTLPDAAGSGSEGVLTMALAAAEAHRVVPRSLAERIRRVARGVAAIGRASSTGALDETWRRAWLHEMGEEGGAALALRAAMVPLSDAEVDEWLRLADLPQVRQPTRWFSGEEVGFHFGLPPGPAVGRLLRHLERETVAGRIADREQATIAARAYLAVEIKR